MTGTSGNTLGEADAVVVVDNLARTFRKRAGWLRSKDVIQAVRGISFSIAGGSIFGLLGPNGAGKTTTIKMLSTLLIPTAGAARIDGYDVVEEAAAVRARLGVLFGGDRGLYYQLSGRENLRYFGRLYGMETGAIARRSAELLDRVGLSGRSDERVESYSRGMKQRLHIAKTLLHQPRVIILDEPTIGLDPAAAIDIRSLISDLVPGCTVLLTTHDMQEADELCEQIAIVDDGLIVATGSPEELRTTAGVEGRVVIAMADFDGSRATLLQERLSRLPGISSITCNDGKEFTISCDDTAAVVDRALFEMGNARSAISSIDIRKPSLEDAYLAATGHEFEKPDVAPIGEDTL